MQHYTHLMLPVWMSNSTSPDQYGVAQYCVPAIMYIAQDKWLNKGKYIWSKIYIHCIYKISLFMSPPTLKLRNRISWNLLGSKDTICSCAYYQKILIAWILWELCPFELRNFPKFTTEAACQRNSSETV